MKIILILTFAFMAIGLLYRVWARRKSAAVPQAEDFAPYGDEG